MLVPLWDDPIKEAAEEVGQLSEFWGKVSIQGSGTYLGFVEGPTKGDASCGEGDDQARREMHAVGGDCARAATRRAHLQHLRHLHSWASLLNLGLLPSMCWRLRSKRSERLLLGP